MQEHSGGAEGGVSATGVGAGDGVAESDVSQLLKRVRKLVIIGVSMLPHVVPLGKLSRSKRCQAQKIIGAVFDHVDSEVVTGVDAKLGAMLVANTQPPQLEHPVEG